MVRLTGGVPGADDNHDAGLAVLPGRADRSPQLFNVHGPVTLLNQVVADLERERGGGG